MELKTPANMCLSGNLADNWAKFKQRFELYLEATEKIGKPDKLKVALLLTTMGNDCIEIFNSFKLSTADAEKYDSVMRYFDDYFEPKKNTVIARYKFFNCKQAENESVESFVTNLKNLSKDCSFEGQEESLIRDLLIIGIRDLNVKEKLLIDSELSLAKAIEYCRAKESSEKQIQLMKDENIEVNYVRGRKINTRMESRSSFQKSKHKNARLCSKCNSSHEYRKCPAYGQRCRRCKKLNHYAAVCKNKTVHDLKNSDITDVADIYEDKQFSLDSIISEVKNKTEWRENIVLNGFKCAIKIDTGAEVNIINKTLFKKCGCNVKLEKPVKVLKSYSGHSLKVLGTCILSCKYGSRTEYLKFYVVDQDSNSLLSLNASEQLGILNRKMPSVVNNIDIFHDYNDVFSGKLGKLPYVYDIKLKEHAIPKIVPPRIIPATLRDKVKTELDNMVSAGILKEVKEPTDWVHPIVVVQKPNKDVRICIDPRTLNKYVKREHHPLPTQQLIFSQLEGSKYFSVLDASSAFLQIPLTEKGSKLCTIATPYGRYRFCRLPYGLCSSPEVYQKTMDCVFAGIEGIVIYIDDILVYGQTEKEHDERLHAVLTRARKFGLILSKEKSQIKVQSVKYLGYNVSSEGLSLNTDKVKAIIDYKTPTNKIELHRFLGMITYLGKFISNLSDKTGLLRKLMSKNTEFVWTSNEGQAFEELKKCVMNAPVLAYFDVNKHSIVSVDSSQYGLGAVLIQDHHPVAYSSTSLSETQQRYSQIEKELLAVLNGCKKFHYYVYGTKFTVETDHKPLLGLLQKPIEKLSPRLQRMALELFKYDFALKHVPGKKLYIADALSRSPTKGVIDTKFLEGEATRIHAVLTASEKKTKELQSATLEDEVMGTLKKFIYQGWPKCYKKIPDNLKPFWDKKSELHCYQDLMFIGNRLVVPKKMRKEVLAKLHVAHQGITSCQNKAKSTIYWPKMMEEIKNFVESCSVCQQHQRANTKQPLTPYTVPAYPWEEVGVDFMHLESEDFLVLTDYHSKFIEVRKLSRKTAESVVSALKQIFRTHGIPRKVHSDNGPPFDSRFYQSFAKSYDFEIVTSSPKYARSNGMIERAIGTMKNILYKVKKERGDPNLAILEYNNTPKYNLPSPAQMLMGRAQRNLCPTKLTILKPRFPTRKTKFQLEENQKKQIEYHDRSAVDLDKLKIKQPVLIQMGHRDWIPGTVLQPEVTPRSYIVKTPSGTELRRNRIHLKPDLSASLTQSPAEPNTKSDVIEPPKTEKEPEKNSEPTPINPSTPRKERPKRLIKKPLRFQDYVT